MAEDPDRPSTPVIRVTDLGATPTDQVIPLAGNSSDPHPPVAQAAAAKPESSTARRSSGAGTKGASLKARPTRRRRKSKHIAFTVSTTDDEDEGSETPVERDGRRRSSGVATPIYHGGSRASSIRSSGNGNGNGNGHPEWSPHKGNGGSEMPGSRTTSGESTKENTQKVSSARRLLDKVLSNPHLAWIKPKLNMTGLKPVIRTSLSVRRDLFGLADDSCGSASCSLSSTPSVW